jgi:hypothetical protein
MGELSVLSKDMYFKFFISWLENTAEYKAMNFKHQPNPDEVGTNMLSFIKEYHNKVNSDLNHYSIAIGMSHSWTIDVAIHLLIPGLRHNISELIGTSRFCKTECNQFNYLKEWVNLPN